MACFLDADGFIRPFPMIAPRETIDEFDHLAMIVFLQAFFERE